MNVATAVMVVVATATFAQTAVADGGCTRSRDELLNSSGRSLSKPPQTYQALFRICLETSEMANVKDAFILEDGGIAAIPQREGLAATAITLAAFCRRFPHASLRFLTGREMRDMTSTNRITRVSSGASPSCGAITGRLS
jgi:hypothetical protein